MKQRMLSLLLCCVIFCSAFSGDTLTGKAEESARKDSGSLEVHEHTDECYRLETNCLYSDGQKEGNSSGTDESHICTEESGCITRILDCPYKDQDGEDILPEPEEPERKEESGDTEEQEKEEEKKPEGEEGPAVILSWEWIDEDEMLVWSEETGQWGLGLPGASEENKVTAEILKGLLPASITASLGEEQTEVLTLDWDFSILPEEGVWEGSYVLTAGVPEGYALGEEVTELRVLLEVGGGAVYLKKAFNQWSYVPRKGIIQEKDGKFVMEMLAPSGQSDEMLRGLINDALPSQIRCWGFLNNDSYDDLVTVGFIFDKTGPGKAEGVDYSKVAWGWINIAWRKEEISKTSFKFDTEYSLHADVQPSKGNQILLNANTNNGIDNENNESNPDLLELTIIIHDIKLEDHIVQSVNPLNTTVNLFDYWVDTDGANGNDILNKSEKHNGADSSVIDVPRTAEVDWNKGVNKNRILLFGDGNIHAGFWNKGAGAGSDYGKKAAGMTGIVESLLDESGYPVINEKEMRKELKDITGYEGISDWQLCGDHIGEPSDQSFISNDPKNISNTVIRNWENSENNKHFSLDYLFDPTIGNGSNKRSYTDVKGLFQIDSAGYYYYDMRQNFAEYDKDESKFILYDAPAVERTDANYDNDAGDFTGERSVGNFFPFNTGAQVFDGKKVDDTTKKETLYSSENIKSHNGKINTSNYMNHHLGMTVNIDFRQPLNGKINTGSGSNNPMTFQFSGDDDVWIFIDDVLVLDLGGIHSEIYGTIDFSTGEVKIGQSWKTNGFPYKADGTVDLETLYKDAKPTYETDLKTEFTNAGKADDIQWNGNTFASNTSHTLKMFYLERGNYDSSLALRFNLQTPLYQQVKKVDQNGNPLSGVEFDLYPATDKDASGNDLSTNDEGAIECLYTDTSVHGGQKFYVKQEAGSESLIRLSTASDGTSRFIDENGNYFNFADGGDKYYILKEIKTPAGYRRLPVDIVLHYDPSTSMLSVANRWSTGAYACSVAHIAGNGTLHYGNFTGQAVTDINQTVPTETQADGLAVAVPLLHRTTDNVWEPLYGSNLTGFISPPISENGTEEWQKAVIRAALEQAADTRYPNWYLSWDPENLRLTSTIEDLPGLANRYTLMNSSGDMQMLYGIFTKEALTALGISGGDAEARYIALGKYVRDHGTEDALSKIMAAVSTETPDKKGVSLLYPGRMSRDFRSLIYIPNEERELWVMKIDQDGKPRNGARFGLYSDAGCTGAPVAQGTTGNVNGQDGTLIFSPANNNSPGHAQIGWVSQGRTHYYLKEISAPPGCQVNNTVIPVVVGTYSIYADAGVEGDGVSVMAGVGRLTQVMRQYAIDDDVDITLRDITATQQQQPSTNTEVLPKDWTDVKLDGTGNPGILRSMNLHFGKNSIIDYGLHDEDGGERYKPYFVTDTGFIRARVQQNWAAFGQNSIYGEGTSNANKDNLGDTDITNLFSLLNIVVVTDPTTQDTNTGRLMIRKTVSGSNASDQDYTKNFKFIIELTDKDGNALAGNYYFYGTDKAGYISNGAEFPLHHDEQIIILGLPAGTRFTVTEKDESQGWNTIPEDHEVTEEIIKDATAFAPFFNSRDPWGDVGVLIIHKAVAGSGDRKKEFTFHITFQDADGNELKERFPYSGSREGDISSGESIKLSHDQYIMIFLPTGTKYTISEEEAGQDGYVTESRNDSGVIEDREDYTAVFINRKEPESPSDPGTGSGRDPGRSRSTHISGQSGFAVNSADTSDLVTVRRLLLILALSSIGALVFALWRNPEKCVKWFRKKLKKYIHKNRS